MEMSTISRKLDKSSDFDEQNFRYWANYTCVGINKL